MIALPYIILLSLGLIIGSFLNVVLFRYGTGKTVGGRSQCMSCGKILSWFELIPVVSFIIQKRRCRSCATTMSWQYPLVEAATALSFVLVGHRVLVSPVFEYGYGWGITLTFSMIAYLALMSLFIVVAVYDIRHKIILDEWTLAIASLGIVMPVVAGQGFGYIVFALLNRALAVAILGGFFWLIWNYSRGKAMGFGDVKFAAALGIVLGLDQGIVAIVLAFWSGAIVGLLLIAASKYRLPIALPSISKFKSQIPFGPFLVLGAFLTIVFNLHFLSMLF